MACVECLKTCNGLVTPDKCIEYTGDTYDLLGICTEDSLFQVENVILNTLLTLQNGTGITISGLNTNCSLITGLLGFQIPTVPTLLQTLINASCSLQAQITTLSSQVNAGYTFATQCLIGVTSTSSIGQIIQATINQSCLNDTRITAIENDYVKQSDLCTQVTACIGSGGGGGGGTSTDFNLRMIPYSVIPYVGSLANFDNTGKGLASAGFDKIYLMNGLNGTQDWRGRSPIGAIQNVPGGVLDSAVDPNLPANAGTNYIINQKVGVSNVTLSISQIPSHSHFVNDPGHKHTILNMNDQDGRQPGASTESFYRTLSGNTDTAISTTGITIQSSGGGLAHTNTQPSVACYYIIYIP